MLRGESGNHQRFWKEMSGEKSSSTQVQVPLFEGKERWGSLQMSFKPLAVTGDRRHPLLPEVPTFKELGFEGFEGVTWYGIVGPARLPHTNLTPAQRTSLHAGLERLGFFDWSGS